jgi:hypothetical protein
LGDKRLMADLDDIIKIFFTEKGAEENQEK